VGNLSVLQGLFGRSGFQLLVLVVVVLVLLTVRLLRARGYWRIAGSVAGLAFTLTVFVVLFLTLRPFARPGAVEPMLMLDPVAGAWGWDRIAWGPVIDNVALFVPVGALAAAAFARRSPVVVWFGCVLLSVVIEATQYLVPTGRVANSADVLANGVGALIGVLLGLTARPRAAPTSHRPPPVRSGAV
jgi:glycopeptide antibiotics resistance protein